jgi:hypothetical protein
MKKLMDYYNERQKKLYGQSIAIWVFLTAFLTWAERTIEDFLSNHSNSGMSSWLSSLFQSPNTQILMEAILKWLIALFAPTAIVTLIFYFRLKIVDTKSWKRKYPQYDISGEWQDTTTYVECLDHSGWSKITHKCESTVIFEQTCRCLKIIPSDGNGFMWKSIAVDWDNQDELNILYQVQYTGALRGNGYPKNRIGYEAMHIDRTGLTERQRPHIMRGRFQHCIDSDGKPMFSGDVVYERT